MHVKSVTVYYTCAKVPCGILDQNEPTPGQNLLLVIDGPHGIDPQFRRDIVTFFFE
jgi:hypothetical protein